MNSADYFDLPIDDPRHRILRDEAWIGGPHQVGRYYLGWFRQFNEFRVSIDQYLQHLKETIQQELPQSAWLLRTSSRDMFMIYWLMAKYRQSQDHQRYPLPIDNRHPLMKDSKADRALVMLLENPALMDEEIQIRLKATPKTMQRWTMYKYARREMRFVAEGLRNDS